MRDGKEGVSILDCSNHHLDGFHASERAFSSGVLITPCAFRHMRSEALPL